ncbi:MAG: hypothetical protein P9M14_11940 [Candidatus Alcyoniella australis]|nr:hypothetical protein [Candidatus Alcyoniella australis]
MSVREERLRLMGRLQELQRELKRLENEADGYVMTIRTYLPPYSDLADLDQLDVAAESMRLLVACRNKWREVSAKAEALERDLG